MSTGAISAGKIVPKSLLVKSHQREKMAQEISLHKTLDHAYIVKLFSYFEDKVCNKYFLNFHSFIVICDTVFIPMKKTQNMSFLFLIIGLCVHYLGTVPTSQSYGIT